MFINIKELYLDTVPTKDIKPKQVYFDISTNKKDRGVLWYSKGVCKIDCSFSSEFDLDELIENLMAVRKWVKEHKV